MTEAAMHCAIGRPMRRAAGFPCGTTADGSGSQLVSAPAVHLANAGKVRYNPGAMEML
jgi:hypothetical protein